MIKFFQITYNGKTFKAAALNRTDALKLLTLKIQDSVAYDSRNYGLTYESVNINLSQVA